MRGRSTALKFVLRLTSAVGIYQDILNQGDKRSKRSNHISGSRPLQRIFCFWIFLGIGHICAVQPGQVPGGLHQTQPEG